jgi:hypothetical protein
MQSRGRSARSSPMRRWPPLRTYMIGLAAASIAPLALLAVALIVVLDRQHRQATGESALWTARALSDAVDRERHDTVASLEALASSPFLDVHDLRRFHDRLAQVGATRIWISAALVDVSGRTLASTAKPFGVPPAPLMRRVLFEEVKATGKPAYSGWRMPSPPSASPRRSSAAVWSASCCSRACLRLSCGPRWPRNPSRPAGSSISTTAGSASW